MTTPATDTIIDVHTHPLLPGYLAAMVQIGGAAADGRPITFGALTPEWSLDEQYDVMERNGIGAAVVSLPGMEVVTTGPSGHARARELNEELAAFVAGDPTRFGAFAVVPMDDMDAALTETAYALDVLGLDGVCTSPHFDGAYLGDSRYDAWFEEMDARRVALFVHPGSPPGFDPAASPMHVSVLEFMFETTRMVTNLVLSGTKQRYPDIDIIATHGGGTIPYLAPRIGLAGSRPHAYPGGPVLNLFEIAEALGSFHYDLTASTLPVSLDAIRDLVPAERLLMGFDFPMMPPETIPPLAGSFRNYTGFDDGQKQLIMSGNARRLFPRFA